MFAIIDYILKIISKLYSILNIQIFSDFPITYIDLIILTFIIPFLFKLIFGGFKEVEIRDNIFNDKVQGTISNTVRKRYINKQKEKNKTLEDVFIDSMGK